MRLQNAKLLTRSAMLLVVLASALAWVAVGALGDGSADGLRVTAGALGRAAELADATSASATALQQSLTTLENGMGSSSEAMDHTIEVSKSVRQMLDAVLSSGEAVFSAADDLHSSLVNAEASLLEVQGGMNETTANLTALEPKLTAAVAVLTKVPDQLRAAQSSLTQSAKRLDRQVVLWRVAVGAGALALVLLVMSVERMANGLRYAQP
jgi:chromosome segregation ATPase